jgi:hypothetical protein
MFAIIVLLIHIMQTIWFIIAIQKRIALEELDKICNFNYLKNRINNTNNNINGHITTRKHLLQQQQQQQKKLSNVVLVEKKPNNYDSENNEDNEKSVKSPPLRITCSLSKTDVNNNNNNHNNPTLVHSNCGKNNGEIKKDSSENSLEQKYEKCKNSSFRKIPHTTTTTTAGVNCSSHRSFGSKRLLNVTSKKSTKALLLAASISASVMPTSSILFSSSSTSSSTKLKRRNEKVEVVEKEVDDDEENSLIQIKIENQKNDVESNSNKAKVVTSSASYTNKNIRRFIDYENESGESSGLVGYDFNYNTSLKSRKRSVEQQQIHPNGILAKVSNIPFMQLPHQQQQNSEQPQKQQEL